MRRTALVVIYNHQYNKNIDTINRLYQGRFEEIYHLVPFYSGNQSNVIPVYDNSFRFQGYVAQAGRQLIASGCDTFVFSADDMVLNPTITGNNIHERMGIEHDAAFIPAYLLSDLTVYWSHATKALHFLANAAGSEGLQFLPSSSEAIDLLQRHGFNYKPYVKATVAQASADDNIVYALPYPLLMGYSDFFVVPAAAMESFCRYAGIFSSMNLFVEIALPTALAFSTDKLQTQYKALRDGAMWSTTEIEALRSQHDARLESLIANFPANKLYLHPIKLSKWS